MKLRLDNKSIRLRLLRSEVDALRDNQTLQETLHIAPDQRLTYTLAPSSVAQATANLSNNELRIELPQEQFQTWAATEQVGIYAQLDAGNGRTLSILVEKDFACLDRSDADNTDTFDHPNTAC